jgi:2'-5' RNA ligase
MKRVFTAIDLSDSARSAAGAVIEDLKSASAGIGAKWVAPANLHITLRFFGNCSPEQIESLMGASENALAEIPRFSARLTGTGVFPRKAAPKVFWIGIEDDGMMVRSKEALDAALTGHGFEEEKRRFHPHLTVARTRDPAAAASYTRDFLSTQFEPVEFEVSRITVYESVLRPTGPEYVVLNTIGLAA